MISIVSVETNRLLQDHLLGSSLQYLWNSFSHAVFNVKSCLRQSREVLLLSGHAASWWSIREESVMV